MLTARNIIQVAGLSRRGVVWKGEIIFLAEASIVCTDGTHGWLAPYPPPLVRQDAD